MTRKIVIATHKGGAGKTTTAKNLAAAMALKGHRVLLADLDEQANVTQGLGVNPMALGATINDLFANPSRDPRSVILPTEIEGLYLMPGHPDLAKTETGMTLQRADPNGGDPILALRDILSSVEDDFDYIVLDTPPSIKYMTNNALAAADELVIPVAASAYGESGLQRTLEAYEQAVSRYNPGLRLRGILITRVKRTNAAAAVLDGIKETHFGHMLPQAIVESTAVDEAEQLGKPVVLYDPESTAAQGYKRVAEILIGEH